MLAATAPTTDRSMYQGRSQTKACAKDGDERWIPQPNRYRAADIVRPKGLDPDSPVTEVLTLRLRVTLNRHRLCHVMPGRSRAPANGRV